MNTVKMALGSLALMSVLVTVAYWGFRLFLGA